MTPTTLVTVTAQQPLALGVTSEVSFFTDSHPFVPGSVLRGALAAAWIAEYGPPTAENPDADPSRFRELFDGGIRYGPLYAAGSTRVPISVLRCKYPNESACDTTVVDQAFEATVPCPGCGRRLEQSKGALTSPAGGTLRRTVRTSIDEATGRAREGELYAKAAIPAGTVLTGTIHGADAWLRQSRTLRLGGRRSVGGGATFCAEPGPAVDAGDLTLPPGTPLVVRLVSPAIFVDVAGRPRLEPDPTLDLAGAQPGVVVPDRSWTRPVTWEGWHAASRLPKPVETCAAAGSTYRFTGEPHALARLADRILREGIGLRRAEGFGVAEIATRPWRPTKPAPTTQPVGDTTPTTTAEAHRRLRNLQVLKLDEVQRPWLVDALRGLQIEIQRAASLDEVLDAVLAQPTALGMTGRQREAIRTTLAGITPQDLRNLTILAATAPGLGRPATPGEGTHQ